MEEEATPSRFSELRNEFWRLHAAQGTADPADSATRALLTRGPSVELPPQDKLDLMGFSNLSFAGNTATRYAGNLPTSRLGDAASVAVLASPKWITGGAHLVKHTPSFNAFCEQQQQRQGGQLNKEVELEEE